MTLNYYIIVNEMFLYNCGGKITFIENKNNYMKNHQNSFLRDKNKDMKKIIKYAS